MEIYERPDKSYFQEPIELTDIIDTRNIIQRFLPKQTYIDKIIEIIKKEVLKDTHLPLMIKEIQVGYLNSLSSTTYINIKHRIGYQVRNQQ